MKKLLILTLITMSINAVVAQNLMLPELLWKLGRISPLGISKDEKNIIYKVSTPSVEENKSNSKYYSVPVNGGNTIEISDYKSLLADKKGRITLRPFLTQLLYEKHPVLNAIKNSNQP